MSAQPDPYLPLLRQGLEHQRAARLDAAEIFYRQVLETAPQHAMALHLLGVVLAQTQRQDEAVLVLRRSVALNPNDPAAFHNLAGVLLEQHDFQAAAEAARQATVLVPAYVAAFCREGQAWQALKQFGFSLRAYDRALAVSPDNRDALIGRIRSLIGLQRLAEACDVARQVLTRQDTDGDALRLLGVALDKMHQYEAAANVVERALALSPGDYSGMGALMMMRMRCCLWRDYDASGRQIEELLLKRQWVAQPFALLAFSASAEAQLRCAQLQMQATAPARPMLPLRARQSPHRVRVAYLSADFHAHATVYLMAELFELHDHSRFEIWGVSFGPPEQSVLRQRIETAFDHFCDVSTLSDAAVADMLVIAEIDIAIDLKGFTHDSRPGVFQFKPAPVVVNYLGFPGTMGAACFDYIIGDPVVTPLEHAEFYSEKIVQLPHSYQVNDRQREIASYTPTREAQGLPTEGFVFACFNNNYKITPPVFAVWMRLLARVDGSVLWLLADNDDAVANLRREAEARGIDRNRLVFAPRAPLADHLARHRLADLFLDTLPCNAHTTASDALWAGLPVLTCLGTTFAGRVAASLLTAVGLPELVTHSLEAYETLALQLATHPAQLRDLRHKLAAQRDTSALFDTPQFVANLEKAYLQMYERYRQGLPPAAMAIS